MRVWRAQRAPLNIFLFTHLFILLLSSNLSYMFSDHNFNSFHGPSFLYQPRILNKSKYQTRQNNDYPDISFHIKQQTSPSGIILTQAAPELTPTSRPSKIAFTYSPTTGSDWFSKQPDLTTAKPQAATYRPFPPRLPIPGSSLTTYTYILDTKQPETTYRSSTPRSIQTTSSPGTSKQPSWPLVDLYNQVNH